MKISAERCNKLFSAIADPIEDERVKLVWASSEPDSEIDLMLFQLQFDIWAKVKSTLGIEE